MLPPGASGSLRSDLRGMRCHDSPSGLQTGKSGFAYTTEAPDAPLFSFTWNRRVTFLPRQPEILKSKPKFAPSRAPALTILVLIDSPRRGRIYGGAVAAPVFSQVVQQTLRLLSVPPDIEVTPQIMASKTVPAERESF